MLSSSFRAERGRRSRDTADADAAAGAHSICGKMKSSLSSVLLCAREGIERNQKKLHFFHSFLFHRGTVSQFPSRNRSSNTETHPTSAFKKNCRNTRVDSHAHTHALKTFTSSRLRKKKRERERERYVLGFTLALSFLLRRKVSL